MHLKIIKSAVSVYNWITFTSDLKTSDKELKHRIQQVSFESNHFPFLFAHRLDDSNYNKVNARHVLCERVLYSSPLYLYLFGFNRQIINIILANSRTKCDLILK